MTDEGYSVKERGVCGREYDHVRVFNVAQTKDRPKPLFPVTAETETEAIRLY